MTHSSVLRGTYIVPVLALGFLFLLLPNRVQSQVFCDFTTDPNEQLSVYHAVSTQYTVAAETINSDNDILYYDEVQSLDNRGAVIQMSPSSLSSVYRLGGFNVDLPMGAVVAGIEILLVADPSIDGAIEDELIRLTSTTENKANRALSGVAWQTELSLIHI